MNGINRKSSIDDKEKRAVARLGNHHSLGVSAKVYVGNRELNVKIKDYHSEAIAIEFNKDDYTESDNVSRLVLYFGSKCICDLIEPKIIRKITSERVLVFSNIKASKLEDEKIERAGRFRTHSRLPCYILAGDPLNSTRTIQAQIIDFSTTGMKISSSLANKHLLPGMPLKELKIFFGGVGFFEGSGRISWIKQEDNNLTIGIKVDDIIDYQKLVFHYALLCDVPIEKLGVLDKKSRTSIKNIISLTAIESKDHIKQVLDLRYRAYQRAKKLNEYTEAEDLWDDFDARSIILTAKVGSKIVGTARLVSCFSDKDKFQFETFFKHRPKISERLGYYEVSRLAIDSDYQGTDILIAMFSYIFEITLKTERLGVYCFSTKNLSSHYRRISGIVLERGSKHPVTGEEMYLMRLERENVIHGKHMPGISWKKISERVVDHLNFFEFGLGEPNRLRLNSRAWLEKKALNLIKKVKK